VHLPIVQLEVGIAEIFFFFSPESILSEMRTSCSPVTATVHACDYVNACNKVWLLFVFPIMPSFFFLFLSEDLLVPAVAVAFKGPPLAIAD
jgi:hypothetical protein